MSYWSPRRDRRSVSLSGRIEEGENRFENVSKVGFTESRFLSSLHSRCNLFIYLFVSKHGESADRFYERYLPFSRDALVISLNPDYRQALKRINSPRRNLFEPIDFDFTNDITGDKIFGHRPDSLLLILLNCLLSYLLSSLKLQRR